MLFIYKKPDNRIYPDNRIRNDFDNIPKLSTIEENEEEIEFDDVKKMNVNDSNNTSNKYYQENDQNNNSEQKNENIKNNDLPHNYKYKQFRIFACIAIICMFFKLRKIKCITDNNDTGH